MSSENLSGRFTLEEIDVAEKLDRVCDVLPAGELNIHVLFRRVDTALFAMYREYVSRKLTQDLKSFLDDLYLFRSTGLLDHVSPSKVYTNVKNSKVSSRDVRLHFYFPDEQNLEFPNIGAIEELWSVKMPRSKLNSLKMNTLEFRRHNLDRYKGYAIYNLLELHRFVLASGEQYQGDFWKERRIRRDIINNSNFGVVGSFQDSLLQVRKSKLYRWIRSEHEHFFGLANAQKVLVHGDVNSLFECNG